MLRYIAFIVFVFLLSSCDKNTIYSEYKSIPNSKWHKDKIVDFVFNVTDTVSKNTVFINLRNNKDYDFNNIFLIASVDFPNKTTIIDTLEYKMTDKSGYFLGTGFTDIKENKLEFKPTITFSTKGNYHFKVQQAMRKNGKENGVLHLNGITDVGISIEKLD